VTEKEQIVKNDRERKDSERKDGEIQNRGKYGERKIKKGN
jgi:hypothetical protein